MRRYLTVALVLFAAPAFAESWADASCSRGLVKNETGYTLIRDEGDEVACTVQGSANGQVDLSCSGEKAVIKADGSASIGDVALVAVTDTGPVCD